MLDIPSAVQFQPVNILPEIIELIATRGQPERIEKVDKLIKRENEVSFQDIDTINRFRVNQNFPVIYEKEQVDFAIEEIRSSRDDRNFVAVKLFNQIDTNDTGFVTATSIHDFLDKADFFLIELDVFTELDETNDDSQLTFNQFAFFGTKLNQIHEELEATPNSRLDIVAFADRFKELVDAKRIQDFDAILNKVIEISEERKEQPATFQVFV